MENQRTRVLNALALAGDDGATDFEIARHLGIPRTSAGKRRIELQRLGLVDSTSRKRGTDSGKAAAVFRLTEKGKASVDPFIIGRGELRVPSEGLSTDRATQNDRQSHHSQRDAALLALDELGSEGATDYELGQRLGILRTTAGMRRLELRGMGLVEPTKRKRLTDRGKPAGVSIVSERGQQEARKVREASCLTLAL